MANDGETAGFVIDLFRRAMEGARPELGFPKHVSLNRKNVRHACPADLPADGVDLCLWSVQGDVSRDFSLLFLVVVLLCTWYWWYCACT